MEWVLRASALGVLVFALVRMILAGSAAGVPVVHANADGAFDPAVRDSLAALARSGDRVTWSGRVAALAATSEPVRDPSARTRISFVGESGARIADSLGLIDSLGANGTLATAGLAGAVRVVGARAAASTVARLGDAPGRVLVLGRVGWESKFTVAALEESGWIVESSLRLTDTLRVSQGASANAAAGPSAGALGIATHAAVVVLDTAIGRESAAIVRFVRAGGGLILSGEGARAPAFAALVPARAGAEQEGERDAFDRDEPRHALPFFPLTSLREDAAPLERRDADVAIAARRVAAGRVVQSGYAETWRWRMQAERDGPAAHRAFWNQLVSMAAAAPREASSGTGTASVASGTVAAAALLDESPLATIIQRLGAPIADAPSSAPVSPSLPVWLGALALVLLLAEWASRRARGAA
jgi:hypothetical protein